MRIQSQPADLSALNSVAEVKSARNVTTPSAPGLSPDPVASRLLAKAGRGKPLTRSEFGYVASARPDQVGVLSRAAKEREALTRRMRQSRSKQEVRMAHLGAVATAGKNSLSTGEADTRVNQLTDAKIEYMKTKEYRDKPELPPKSFRRKPQTADATAKEQKLRLAGARAKPMGPAVSRS